MVAARPSALVAALIISSVAFTGCGIAEEVPPSTPVPSADPERPTTPFGLQQVAASPEPPPPEDAETTPPEPESPAPTEDPTDISPEPTPSASEAPSESPSPTTSASPTGASSPAQTESTSAPPESDGSGSGSLPRWLGLGALVAAGVALAWRLAVGGRRRAWDEGLEVERSQGVWVATELVPALTNPATPAQHLTQYWADAQPTLDELVAGLAALVADAPDESRASTAQTIAAAVTQVRSSAAAHVALTSAPGPDPGAMSATSSALVTAGTQLRTALEL